MSKQKPLPRIAPFAALCVALSSASVQAGGSGAQTVEQTYARTQYPIVLVHGMGGSDRIFGVETFFRIPEELRSNGARVHVVKLSAFNNEEIRGEQLLSQVQQILASTGARKVNLIGYSQGGLTIRYVASVRPDLVASVTAAHSPHKGSAAADAILGNTGPVLQKLLASAMNTVGSLVNLFAGGGNFPQDSLSTAKLLSTAGMAKFNAKFPSGVPETDCGEGQYVVKPNGVNPVAYYSWTGASPTTRPLVDPTDWAMAITSQAFQGQSNDGLVGTCSSHLGQVIYDRYNMNHFDGVNHFLGLRAFNTDPVTLYVTHANRLKQAGY